MSIGVAGLSSNWKKLQSKIKAEATQNPTTPIKNGPTRPTKRKAEKDAPREYKTPAHRAKKPKLREKATSDMDSLTSSKSTEIAPAGNSKTLEQKEDSHTSETSTLHRQAKAGKYIAIDCEMVGTMSPTPFAIKSRNDTQDFSILARVSLVSYSQEVLYDTYVLPPQHVRVSDYRTQYSGITPWHLNGDNPATKPKPFQQVQEEVAALMNGRILVGHAIRNDLSVLGLSHPARNIRDTGRYPPFRAMASVVRRDGTAGKGRTPALKMLAERILGWDIQSDAKKGHSSVEDAKATMALFQREKKGFEQEALKTFGRAAAVVKAAPRSVSDRQRRKPFENVPDDASEDANVSQAADSSADEEDEDEDLDAIELDLNTSSSKPPSAPQTTRKSKKKKKKKGQYRR